MTRNILTTRIKTAGYFQKNQKEVSKELLFIDVHIVKKKKTNRKNLAMARINFF